MLYDYTHHCSVLQLKQLRKQLKDHDSHSSDGSFISYPTSTASEVGEAFYAVMESLLKEILLT